MAQSVQFDISDFGFEMQDSSNFKISSCAAISRMAVNPELLKILVCPLCKAAIEVVHEGKGLKCSQCHRVYPIRDDIPVMLVSEATVED